MSDKQRKCLSRSAYNIGWICALPLELAASVGMFDEAHQDLDLARGDGNMYTLGEIAGHNIVMACLPAGSTGVTPAATVAANMLRSFPKIRFGLMVGVGGGAPARRARPGEDIRLGDVVVSIPQRELGGVVKYDCGKTVAGGVFEHTGLLNMPPAPLANAVAKLRGMHEAKRSAVSRYVAAMINKVMADEDANPEFEDLYCCPDPKYDQLFAAEYEHTIVPVSPSQEDSDDDERLSSEDEDDIPLPCPHCDPARLVQRKPRKYPGPVIHYGTIASADQVMRHALTRDAIRKKHGILCFDMEAAGLMNDFPCLVVRGICDYADTHKHKIWQRYAAATAAAYTKELLQVVLREDVETTEEVVKILERVEHGVHDIKQNVDRLAKDRARQDRDRILNWLDSDTHTKRLLDSYEKWQPSTVQKLFESEAYRDWTYGEAQTLWCPGIAGGGKTVFSSVVVSSLKAGQEAQAEASRAAVLCLFCEYERQKEQTLRTLAAAMLRQLADQCELLPDELGDLFEKHGTGASSHLRFEDVSLALTRLLKEFPRVYLIVDALDECSDQTRRELLAHLAEQQRKTGLRILATARPTVEFEKEFSIKCQELEIRADVLDVKSVLDTLIDKSTSFVREDEGLRRRVTDNIVFAVDGMFLLVQPFLDSVIGERSRGHVEDALQTLMDSPDKLTTVYENALCRIGGQKPGDRNLAHRMLSWVVESKRPLTRDEFLHALAIQTGSLHFQRHYILENLDGAVALCAGLVVINERSDTVQLMHHTTRTYLEDPERRPGWMAESRAMIASACVTYISYSVFEDGPCHGDEEMGRRLDEYPFLPYAAQHWGHHGHDAGGETESMQHLALQFLLNQEKLASANQAMHFTGRRYSGYSSWYDREVTALHLVAAFGLPSTTRQLLAATGADAIDKRDGDGRTALHRAAENGDEAVIRILLGHSANIVAEEGTFGQTPLHLAALNGREAATRVLMEHGASSLACDADGWMPIHTASWMGHADVAGTLLVTTDAVHVLSGDGLTALHCAAAQGHAELAQLLIRSGADVNAVDDEGWTPLHWASKKRHDVLKPRVLSLKDETSALLRRFVELQEEMDEVIHQQADVLQDRLATTLRKPLDFWQTRLAWLPSGAIGLNMGHEYGEMVAALQMSPNVPSVTLPWSIWNMMGDTGEGPQWQGASEAKEEEEDEPANVRFMFAIQDELTAMHCTTACGHAEVSRLLVRHGADIEQRCHTTIETKFLVKVETMTTALHLAAFSSHEAMVSILLEQGADMRARTESQYKTQGVEFVRPKPAKKFGMLARPDVEWTPLHCGVVSGSEDVVQMLLDIMKGAGVQETGIVDFFTLKCELTALHMAVVLGYVGKVRLLLAGGANVNAQGWINLDLPLNYHSSVEKKKTLPFRMEGTSLQLATLLARNEMMGILIQRKADVEAKLRIEIGTLRANLSSLQIATICRRKAAIQLLLDQRADATAKILVRVEGDENNGAELNGLHLMAFFRDWRLADSLIHAGADVNDELRIDVNVCKAEKLADLHRGGPDGKHGRDKGSEEEAEEPVDSIHAFFTRTARNFVALLGDQLEDTPMFGSLFQTLERQDEKETSYHVKIRSTALSLAILAVNEQVVQVLIDNGADMHVASMFAVGSLYIQCQPLHLAVLCGAEAAVAHLIDAGADTCAQLVIQVGEEIRVCLSPLHLACLIGHETLVGLLLERGVDARALCRVNDEDENVVSALHFAALLGQEAIVAALVDSKGDASQRCRLLLRPKIDMEMDLSASHLAALSGNVHVVKTVLDTDHDRQQLARLDCHKMHATFTVLHLAALWGHEQVVTHLLEKGHDVHTPCVIDIQYMSHVQLTCLHLAAFAGGLDMMTRLLDAGADVHQAAVIDGPAFRTKLTALHITAFARHRGLMEMLLDLDMDIHLPVQADVWEEMHVELSLLHIAALWRVQVTQLLLDKGFDVNARLVIQGPETHAEMTALHMAAGLDNKRLALLLLDREADPNARALVVTDDVNVDMTALHVALGRRCDDMVRLLVSKRPLRTEEHAWLASDADSDGSSLLSEVSNSTSPYDSNYTRPSNRSSPGRSYFSPRADGDSQNHQRLWLPSWPARQWPWRLVDTRIGGSVRIVGREPQGVLGLTHKGHGLNLGTGLDMTPVLLLRPIKSSPASRNQYTPSQSPHTADDGDGNGQDHGDSDALHQDMAVHHQDVGLDGGPQSPVSE
ncbi:uncharacterized protein J7T54_007593 [Emericellopsis cladophorae]|uniref:NACHT domain-containing protein n=1 Tax=Emericellopsis cladophorae TaxID=2686198 RepID=A0A9P9XWW2_9HYPO|nr:uncharacterized protein J7T54_007593 [Emericellopsis cladophorae]KAI6779138.1 hypothetical protein J7T54_007593 [Emericellopsis cladophorae]